MKRFTVEWAAPYATVPTQRAVMALTPGQAAEHAYRKNGCDGPREFTVTADDGHISLVKVGADEC